MSQGKILFAESAGTYILKLIGDIRLTICSPLGLLTEEIIKNSHIENVIVDLTQAGGLDSTSLGLLAGIAVNINKIRGEKPVILCASHDILTILISMRFDKIFNIINKINTDLFDCKLNEFPIIEESELITCQRTLKAHKLLMQLSSENKVHFHELVKILEADLQKIK